MRQGLFLFDMLAPVNAPQRDQRQDDGANGKWRQVCDEGVIGCEEDVADDPNAVAARPLRNKDRGDWNPAECVDVCLCHRGNQK